MNREYRVAKGWRIFLYIVLPAAMAGFIYMGLSPFIHPPARQSLYIILPLLSLALNALLAWGLLDLHREKLVLEDDRILQVTAFRTRELPAYAVKGYTQDDNYVILHPAEEGFSTIRISKYTGRMDELKEDLSLRFRNLDLEALEAEEQDLLEDEALGDTEEQRAQGLQRLRRTTRTINGLAWACAAWFIFLPRPYEVALVVAAAFVPVVLYTAHRYKGLVKLDENPKSAYPNLASAFIMPALAVGLRSLLDYSIFGYSQLWTLVVPLAAALYAITLFVTGAWRNSGQLAGSLLSLLFIAFYSYGVVVQYNCAADRSPSQRYEARVLNKRVTTGKSTTYYLELEPWGPQEKQDEVSVPKSLYNRVATGQVLQVYYKRGRLGIPWFFVTDGE